MSFENAIVVTNKTRLEQLVFRFNTRAQARFYIEHSGGDFLAYQREHEQFESSLGKVQEILGKYLNVKLVDRQYLPSFVFSAKDLIVVIGQDGLVANTAKYAKGLPIIAINPDPERYDGILLPFTPENFKDGLFAALEQKQHAKMVTMAEVQLNDGQRLLAFNDFFIGPSSHVSARYRLSYMKYSEDQSSSGIIISTGAGSTGWLSSVLNMTNGIVKTFDTQLHQPLDFRLGWEDRQLVFVVREPFRSLHSKANVIAGLIRGEDNLTIESYMPVNGKIFSDGIENDYLDFNSGAIAKVGIAKEAANIVMK
ncbi:MAG: sugar kinase [Bacteroidota bacterium]